MKTGYIGKGKKAHYIVSRFLLLKKGLCGKHGRIRYTETPVTCRLCLRCVKEIEVVRTGEHAIG